MDFEALLKQWANEQGFQTWKQDNEAVLRNLASWLNQKAAQQTLALDAAIQPPAEHVQNSDIITAGKSDTQPRQ